MIGRALKCFVVLESNLGEWVCMHKFLAKYFIYYPYQCVWAPYVVHLQRSIFNNQCLNQVRLRHLADKKFSKLLKDVYQTNSFYRNRLDAIGFDPANDSDKDIIKKIPPLTKAQIQGKKKQLLSRHHRHFLKSRSTGGSTGKPLKFYKERRALALNDFIMYRCYKWYGIDIGDKQVRFWGSVAGPQGVKSRMKDFLLNRITLSAFSISKKTCLKYYQRIIQFKPDYFYGYTTAIYGFCRYADELGLDLKALNLKAVVCTAETMYPHHRQCFDKVFNCPVVNEYGSSENGVIAFMCPKGNMHMMSDHLIIEFLNDEDEPVKTGESGRIVISDLSSYAMPLIRYDIGDIGSQLETPCSCGVTLPLMEVVEGRKQDFIQTTEGSLVHPAYLCYNLKINHIHEFRVYQNCIDRFLIQIVPSPDFDRSSEKRIVSNFKQVLGHDSQFEFEYLDAIPREKSGKLRYFISNINA